jgi:hypothetical protein
MAKSIEELEQEIELQKKLASEYDKVNDKVAKRLKLEAEIAEQQAIKAKAIQENNTAETIAANKRIENLQKQQQELQKTKSDFDRLSKSFTSMISEAGQQKAPDIGKMFNIENAIQGFGDLRMASKAAVAQMAAGAIMAFAQAIVDLAIDLGDAEAAFMKATGANQDFARSVTNSYEQTRQFGVGIEDISRSYQTLYTTFTDFTMVSQDQRESLAETAAVLDRLGISNESFAASVQLSTKALGMSAAQAGQNMLDLEKFAENLGVAPQQLADDFNNAGGALAKLGADGTQAFKDLAIAAKTTGLSIERIINLTEKFDTFEGAAEQAGKLNAALGGNFVNAMDLMMATDPAERFEMIRDSLLDTGLSFDEMSYYQRNFFKDALGLSDVTELAALMSGEMDLVSGATQESSQSLLDAANRAREMASFQERLNMLFVQMIPIITPVVDLLSDLTLFLASAADEGTFLNGVFKALAGPFVVIGKIIESVSDAFEYLHSSLNPSQLEAFGQAMEIVGYVVGVALVGALAYLAGPLIGIGAAFSAVIAIVSSLAALLFETPFNPPNFLQGLIQIGEAFAMMAEKALMILNPFTLVERAIRGIGSVFSEIIGGAVSFFSVLANPVTAENVERIAKAISQTDGRGAAAYTAAMTATAAGSAAATAAKAVGIGGGGQGTQQITINVMVDREKLATVVRTINGEDALRAISGRA